jgi:ABC-type dipeptide/oligopeptide/nickel transport system permease component
VTRFLTRRLLNYVVLLALASFLTFTLTSLTFEPLDSLLQRNPRPPQSAIDAKAAELDLNEPIPIRYVKWASGAIHGDFGTTVAGQPVSDELWRRIGVSLRLVVIGSLLGTVLGVVVGAWGAIRQYRLSDRLITVLSLLVLSTPTFVVANLLILGALRVNSILGVQLFEYTGETSAASGAADVHPGAGVHRGVQPLPAQCDARRARAGLHPHRARQRADQAAGAVQTRAAHGADPDGDAVRLRRQRPGHRRGVH